ncbi:MAG: hypothetical protein HGB22_10675 [Chlorobiaceae bacterium]|nr:hypothetical protein [Chlorobiaceae bacterium]
MNGRFSFIRIVGSLIIALMTAALPASARAALRSSDVVVSATPDSLLAGERLHYVIAVRHDGRRAISVGALETGQGSSFELAGSKSTTKKLPDGTSEFRMDAELAVFGSGRQQLPGFTVTAQEGGGKGQEKLEVKPPSSVFVMGMTDSTMTEMRPVVPPVKAPFPSWIVVPTITLLLLLFIAGYAVRRLYIALRTHLDDPVRNARNKLRSIRRQLSKGMQPAEGYEALSNILREFLQNRYGFGAMEMVTQEIAKELAARRINIREALLQLLVRADLVKFADSRPNIEECRRSLRVAEVLVGSAGEAEAVDDTADSSVMEE